VSRSRITKEYVGSMKVAIVAYGHADNVLCLSNHLSKTIDVTVIFVMAGNRFTRSIIDSDITGLPFGLTADPNVIDTFLGSEIAGYISPKLKILLARIPNWKMLKDWKRENLKYIMDVSDYIRDNDYDVVHFNGASGFQLYFHFLLRDKHKVNTVHDYILHTGESKLLPDITNRFLNKIYTLLDYEFIQHYQFLSRSFSEFYKVKRRRVHTVYCGPLEIYREFATSTVHEETRTVIFFGRISRYKGVDCLIKAMSIVKNRMPDARTIIAGAGDFWFDFDNDGSFEIYNYHIPNDELVHMIQRASVVVAPYNDATHSAVLMTAFAFSKPVIASAVGGIPEVIRDNVTGRLVPPGDPYALAESILDLLSNPEKREYIKTNIEHECHEGRLSWDKIAADTVRVYEAACCDC
jgi:glycosyltransferase involved in cell wall biosynthesis